MGKKSSNNVVSQNVGGRIAESGILVNFSIDVVYNATLQAIKNCKKFKLKEENKVFNRISIKTKASLFSWGEQMTVQLNDKDGKTELSIDSNQGALSTRNNLSQMTIGKKNKKNIDLLLNEIGKYLK